jgi:hypothetical protein
MPLTNFSLNVSFSGHFIALNPKEACQAPRKPELIDVRVLEWLLSFILLTKDITAQLNPACHLTIIFPGTILSPVCFRLPYNLSNAMFSGLGVNGTMAGTPNKT